MIDDDLKSFLESDVAIIVGTCDGDLIPELVRGYAARVTEEGKEVQLFVGKAAAERTLANLQLNRRIAVTFCSPDNYRTVQIKGSYRDIEDATPEDQEMIDLYQDAFVATVTKYGLDKVIRNIWGADPVRLSLEPDSVFDQTPGPGAGRPLWAGRASSTGDSAGVSLPDVSLRGSDGAAGSSQAAIAGAKFEVPLEVIEECFQAAVPASVCTVALDGMPNATYLSIVQRLDREHVALSRQFFNKTVANLAVNKRCQVMLVDPTDGHQYRLDLLHESTECEGPLFERMRVQLDAVASQTGMTGVFKLQGADVCGVLQCRHVPSRATPVAQSRRRADVAALAAFSRRVTSAASVDELMTESLAAFDECLGYNHSLLLALDELTPDRLYTVGSRGFSLSGVGSEVRLGQGIIGTAVSHKRAIRVGHMEFERTYSRAVRSVVERGGAGESLEREIPLPGLPGARSHLASPILVQDRPLGALYFQSEEYARFHEDDENIISVAAHEIGLAWTILRFAPAAVTASSPRVDEQPRATGEVKHYGADDSVFIDNEYLIKGVAGRIFWALLKKYTDERRIDFTNREIRLDPQLELPALHENLETRLILLRKRLEERCDYLRIVSTGRGRFRLVVEREIRLQEVASVPSRF